MKIDSRCISTPIEVFVSLVACGVGTGLSGCGADLNVWDTDVNDDLSRGIYDGMDGFLRRGLNDGEGVSANDLTYLLLGPKAENPCNMFKPLLSGLLWLPKRSRVKNMAIILVQALCDKVQVLVAECMCPFEDKFGLWRIGAFWAGHWDEAIGSGLL